MSHPELTCLRDWTVYNSRIVHSNRNFTTIFDFFHTNCPVSNISVRSNPLSENWTARQHTTLKLRLENAGNPKIPLYKVPLNELYTKLENMNQLGEVDCRSEFAIYNENEYGFLNLFVSIRNAFAHGSYQIKTYERERYYCFENRKPPKFKGGDYYQQEIRSRMVLKESTLLRWIDIIKAGYQ